MRRGFWSGVALFAMALTQAAQAQEAAQTPSAQAEDRVAYDAAFYAQLNPSTALDMIRRTPGFTLLEGAERRGFSGAVGNVLIDGERPTAKSQELADILQRIPAAQVLRIELLRGAETGADASGQTLIANVVRTPTAGQGVWSLGAEYAAQHQAAPNGWASWSGRLGTTDYSLGASGYSLLREEVGTRETRDGGGDLSELREDVSPRHFYEAALNGEAARNALGGRMRITGQAAYSRYHEDTTFLALSPAGERLGREFSPYTESKRTFETGLTYDRNLAAWDLTLAALITRAHFDSDITSTRRGPTDAIESVFRQAIAKESGESILRGTIARDLSRGRRIEAGLEGALNTLDQDLALTFDFGEGPFPIPVENSNLAVEEARGEAFVAYTQRFNPLWSLDARLAGETSTLSFTGDAEQSTNLAYFKPSLQITRALGARNQMRVRIHRDVSQLDFNDFVSAASLSDGTIEGGNPDLRPETSWRAEIGADLRFGAQGAFGLTVFHHWLEDAQDLVPVGPPEDQFDAPGNIGEGEVSGMTVTLHAPLAPLIPGARLTLDATLQEAEITDPLTHERRTISDFEQTLLKMTFRQDLQAWRFAWGAEYVGRSELVKYRLNEIDTRLGNPPLLDVFVETTAVRGLKLRVTAVSVLDTRGERERIIFEDDRNGPIGRIERSDRSPGYWFLFSASGSF